MTNGPQDLPIELFDDAKSWHDWLAAHHTQTTGIWLRFFKKGRGQSVNYAEALDEALCYGWIDSQVAKYDDDSYLQKFTPRRAKSIWSKRNIEHIERLIKAGRMTPAGLAQAEAAKADGRWDQAYDSPVNMEIPAYFLAELSNYPKAKEFFETLNKTNRYAIAWRLQTAKTEVTRQRRMQALVALVREGKKLH